LSPRRCRRIFCTIMSGSAHFFFACVSTTYFVSPACLRTPTLIYFICRSAPPATLTSGQSVIDHTRTRGALFRHFSTKKKNGFLCPWTRRLGLRLYTLPFPPALVLIATCYMLCSFSHAVLSPVISPGIFSSTPIPIRCPARVSHVP
jgi:hypothetical protein